MPRVDKKTAKNAIAMLKGDHQKVKELFDKLPANAQSYMKRLEALVGAPISIISTGPDRLDTIVLKHPFD